MAGLTERLLQLAAQYDAKAAALRLAASELNGHATTKAVAGLPAALAGAIAIRKNAKSSEKGHWTASAIAERRARTAELLEAIAESGGTPYPKDKVGKAAASLVKSGYIERSNGGYIRTSKEYVTDKNESRQQGRGKKGRPTINSLRERIDGVKRPKAFDPSFPRMRGRANEANVSAFEERVKAYWADR